MARILVVEDDLSLAGLVVESLSAQQHAVEMIADGQEAAEALRSSTYDLVLLDWDLPSKSGLAICKEHREAGGLTPILMLTGRDKVRHKEEGFDAGADDYLTKPFSHSELQARVKALLRRSTEYAVPVTSANDRAEPTILWVCPACGWESKEPLAACPQDGAEMGLKRIDLLPGEILDDRYEIVSLIGQGGMADVYRGEHKLMVRPVAIKILHVHPFRDEVAWKRFKQEAMAVARLNHPSIVLVHDFGTTPDGRPYMVMDLVAGTNLQEILNRDAQLQPLRAVMIFIQICNGLSHAHEQGVVHRDIKPSNIMIQAGDDGQDLVRIVDFGIAKMLPGYDDGFDDLTRTGQCFGTCYYMSPEQGRGEPADRRSDIYALGCVMYEALAGLPPFRGANSLATIQKHLTEPPKPFRALRSDIEISPRLEEIVLKALEKDPNRRYQSMKELSHDLQLATSDLT